MSLDRIVCWQEKKPTKQILGDTLEDYIGEAGKVEWIDDRWYCTFPGKPSSPFRRMLPQTQIFLRNDERWFEVFINSESVDIITRSADEFTNVVAKGFAELLVRFWEARLESE